MAFSDWFFEPNKEFLESKKVRATGLHHGGDMTCLSSAIFEHAHSFLSICMLQNWKLAGESGQDSNPGVS